MSVIIETTLGDIIVDLYTKERKTSCMNFLKLCKIKYYNCCLFFSVQRNFIAQSGDPTGTGKGGESVFMRAYGDQAKYFEMELKPKIKHKAKGMISFANNGSNRHGSQFFFTLGTNLDYLDGKHTVFGEVAEGHDVLEKINQAICDDANRPYQDIRINHTIILDDPFDDPVGLEIPDHSPEPTREQLQTDRIGADEEIDEHRGKSLQEIQEVLEEKDLKIGTQILQTIGDIPDAELKPPENVLFVCKLNPVTTADDLEIIFSRFGPVLSCEIICDHKTGDSLCYGFVEFEKVEDCEKAYFKMDNVLIDDRRIHVNFCQSIAKHKWSKSGLRSKYSFSGKEEQSEKHNLSSSTGKFIMKNNDVREKYEMIFQDHSKPVENKSLEKKNKRSSHSQHDYHSVHHEYRKQQKHEQRRNYQAELIDAEHFTKQHSSKKKNKKKFRHRRGSSDESSNESTDDESNRRRRDRRREKVEENTISVNQRKRSSYNESENYHRNRKEKKSNNRKRLESYTDPSSSEDFAEEETKLKRKLKKKKRQSNS